MVLSRKRGKMMKNKMAAIVAAVAVIIFFAGFAVIGVIGDSIENSTGSWIPSLLLAVIYIIIFVIILTKLVKEKKN